MLGIPKLAIIDIDKARLHEMVDPPRVERLKEQIKKASVLKDPVIVTKFDGVEDYMVVDGATRTTALKELGFNHILVQIVNYDDDALELKSWDHAIKSLSSEDIIKQVQALKAEVKFKPIPKADTFLKEGEIDGYFVFQDSTEALCVTCMGGLLQQEVDLINHITDIYTGKTEIIRIIHPDLETIFTDFPEVTSVYCTKITKSKVKRIFAHNMVIAAGITRHLIPTRVLRLNIELDFLKDDNQSTQEKNTKLEQLVRKRMDEKSVRFYAEPLYLFDN